MSKKSNFSLKETVEKNSNLTTVKLSVLVDSIDGLLEINKIPFEPIKSSEISKTLMAINSEVKEYYDIRDKRIKELGERVKDKDTGELTMAYKVKPENDDMWQKEHKELLDKEVEVKISKISLKGIKEALEFSAKITKDNKENKVIPYLPPSVFNNIQWLLID